MATSINLKMKTATDKDISQAITDISPDATNSDLKTFAQGLAALTTNTLVSTSKITKEDISGNYYDPVIAFQSDQSLKLYVPTLSGNKIQISLADFKTAADDAGVLKTTSMRFSVTANDTNIANVAPAYIISTFNKKMVYGSLRWGKGDPQTADVLMFIYKASETLANMQAAAENMVLHIEGGQSGDLKWNAADFYFEFAE